MSGHTPGPWGFSTEPQPNGCPIVGARGLMVAMLAHTVNQEDQREVALANARLIAAAPALLEALQAIADCCNEEHATRDYASRQAEIRGIARAAIDKAVGRRQRGHS